MAIATEDKDVQQDSSVADARPQASANVAARDRDSGCNRREQPRLHCLACAAVRGVATWIVVSWWNHCRANGKYPELSTKNGFTARCVR